MEPKSVAKVGLVAILAIATFFAAYFYLAHLNPNTYKVHVAFADTQGLLKQSVVRMQGVNIGEVTAIDLDTKKRPPQPVVTLAINRQYRIPEHSKFVIVSGLLISNPVVQIEPTNSDASLPTDDKASVQGSKPIGALASLSPELSTTVQNLNGSFQNLNDRFIVASNKINRLLDTANKLAATTNQAAASAKNIIGDPLLKPRFFEILDNFRQVSQNAGETSKELSRSLRAIIKKGEGPLTKLPSRLNDILARVDTTIDNANTIFTRLSEQVTDPRFQQSLQETAELAKTTLARFNQIASDLHEFTGDPTLRNDLKSTVTNLRATTAQGEEVVEKVNTLLGRFSGATGKGPRLSFPPTTVQANVSQRFDPSNLRVDLDARIATGHNSLVDLGLFDIGETTRVNIQAGQQLTPSLLAREGLYASKLGVGLEYMPTPGTGLRGDLYDTNHPRLDVRGLIRVNKNASVWIGADGILRRVQPTVGVQFSR